MFGGSKSAPGGDKEDMNKKQALCMEYYGFQMAVAEHRQTLMNDELSVHKQQETANFLAASHGRTTKANLTSFELLLCGSISGAISKTILAPLDRVKLLYFVSPSRDLSFSAAWKTFSTIWKATGIRGLFKGNASAMWRVIPYSGITFASYQRYKELIMYMTENKGIEDPVRVHMSQFLGGSLAGTTAAFFTHPLDLIRARAGAHWSLEPLYRDSISGIIHIGRTEGLRGLYAGITPSIIGIIPYSGTSFYLFERFKLLAAKFTGVHTTELSTPYRLLSGGLAAAISSAIVHPLHVVRRRMQVYGVTKDTPRYDSTWSALTSIYKKEGIRKGLFKGMLMTQLKAPIGTAISFALNDTFTHRLDLQKQDWMKDIARQQEDSRKEQISKHIADSQMVIQRYKYHQTQQTRSNTPVIDHTRPGSYDFAQLQVVGVEEALERKPSFTNFDEKTKFLNSTKELIGESTNAYSEKPPFSSENPEDLLVDTCFTSYRALLPEFVDSNASQTLSSCHDQSKHLSNIEMLTNHIRNTSDVDKYGKLLITPVTTSKLSNTSLLIIGAISGSLSKTVICPGDNIKMLYQVNAAKKFTLRGAVKTGAEVIATKGWKTQWRGNTASLVRTAPYSAITYMTFEKYHSMTSQMLQNSPALSKFLAGGMSGVSAVIATYPLDMIRVRMAAAMWDANHPAKNYIQGFRHVYQAHGARGLYAGLVPTILGVFPYTGTSFMTYHTLKDLHLKMTSHEPTIPVQVVYGGVAALISQSVCYPLDVIRRRKQMGLFQDMSTAACIKSIWVNEGWRNFYKSLSMNWIKGPIAAGISFMTNDQLKKWASRYKDISVKS